MALPILTTGQMIDQLKNHDKAVIVKGKNRGVVVFYERIGNELELWAEDPKNNSKQPFRIVEHLNNCEWSIIPKYCFVEVEEAIRLYKTTTKWIAVVFNDEEIIRFRNKSMKFVESLKDGKFRDEPKKSFSLPISYLDSAKWAVVEEVGDDSEDEL